MLDPATNQRITLAAWDYAGDLIDKLEEHGLAVMVDRMTAQLALAAGLVVLIDGMREGG